MKKIRAIGLAGVARSGKDSFYSIMNDFLPNIGVKTLKFSFAKALRLDVREFLFDKTGIDSFTEKNEEKEIIRDFLVAYGTKLMRRIDEDCWIKKLEKEVLQKITEGYIPVFTDVRYLNELKWVKNTLNGHIVHITRINNPPANDEEKQNDPLLLSNSDDKYTWYNFVGSEPDYEAVRNVRQLVSNIFDEQ